MELDQIFNAAKLEAQPLTRAGLASFVQACAGDFQSGLLEFLCADGARYDLLMAHGQTTNFYRRADHAQPLPPETWLENFPADGQLFRVRSLALTPQTLRLAKILLEQRGAGQPLADFSPDPAAAVSRTAELPQPGLLLFGWENASALALLPGAGRPPRHSLFIAGGQIVHSAGNMMALYGWREPLRTLTRYDSLSLSPAWQEYILHHAFVSIVEHLLARFEQLTGRILLHSLVRELNYAASANGWNLSLTGFSLADQTIFPGPRQQAEVYRRLLMLIHSRLTAALGDNLVAFLLQEGQARLRPPYAEIFDRFLQREQSAPLTN
ncbi:MAG: hypothetical protein Fur0035_21930 [Anaerolineales bacterium]